MGGYGKILLVDKIYSDIKKRIISGKYLPGRRLVEAELKEEFNVSRVTLREALRRLIVDDLVVLVPNKGIHVRELSHKEIIDIYTVRESLEGLAARLAAEMPRKRLKNLQLICSKGAVAVLEKNRMNHRALNSRFHMELAQVTENNILIKIIERLSTQIIGSQFISLMTDQDMEISQQTHEKILEAILAGDGDSAELIMRNHIKNGREFILSAI